MKTHTIINRHVTRAGWFVTSTAFSLLVGAGLLVAADLIAWHLDWPPTAAGAWYWASPLIALFATLGWLCLVPALLAGPRARIWRRPGERGGTIIQPTAPSYLDIARSGIGLCLFRAAWPTHFLAGFVILPSAFMDLAVFLMPEYFSNMPIHGLAARGLYFMGLIVTHGYLISIITGLFTLMLAIDLGLRLWPANDDVNERFALASIADPVVTEYRKDVERQGRRLLIEDRERLKARLKLDGSVSHGQ